MDLAEILKSREALSPLARERRRRRPRTRRLRASRPAATDERLLARQLRSLIEPIEEALRERLFPMLERLEPQYLVADAAVRDTFADDLEALFARIQAEHLELAAQRSELVARDLTQRVNARNRQRFFESVESAIGIDLSSLVSEAELGPVLKLKTRENVNLIKTIPESYFDKVQTVVYENVIQGRKPAKSMIEELRELGAETDRRAKMIARDQTAKLTAALNRERNQALGITEYIWRTSMDERVRPSHKRRNGQRFRWDNPPSGGPADGGHPGEAINCRCVAEPVIEV